MALGMIEMWITPVLLAYAFLYSKFYNRRRTEHPTYALWNTVLTALRPSGISPKVHGDLGDSIMVAPQYEVYVSINDKELDADETRASLETRPDSQTESLFFDFAIILLVPAMRLGDTWKGSITAFFQELLKAEWNTVGEKLGRVVQAARIRIHRTHILAAVELKRPPPRTSNIRRWMKFLGVLIQAAMDQSFQQCVYVLRSKRYESSREHGMFLIAGAGEWFTLRWVDFAALEGAPDFSMAQFQDLLRMLDANQARQEALEEEIKKEHPDLPLGSSADEVKRKDQMAARAARSIKRAMGTSTEETAQQKKTALMKLSPPFTDDELEEYWQLADKGEFKGWKPGSTFLQQFPANGISSVSLNSVKDWTRPMRLGSPVGNLYMEFVRRRLETVAQTIVPFPPLSRGK